MTTELGYPTRAHEVMLWIVGALSECQKMGYIENLPFGITMKGLSGFDAIDTFAKPSDDEIREVADVIALIHECEPDSRIGELLIVWRDKPDR